MDLNLQVQYLDPLLSSRENLNRLGFLKPGRYHGFDKIEIEPGSGSDQYYLKLFHSSTGLNKAIPVVNTSNEVELRGFMVLAQGVIASSIANTQAQGVTLTIPLNDGSDPAFHAILASYIWEDSEGGNLIDISTEPWVPADLTLPDPDNELSLGATQVFLGYVKVEPGATPLIGNLTLVPSPTPLFAGKDVDITDLAKLKENNHFEAFQSYKKVTSCTYTPETHTLVLDSPSNLIITALPSTTNNQPIKNITWNGPLDSFLILSIGSSNSPYFDAGGNIHINGSIPIRPRSSFIFLKESTGYTLMGAGESLRYLISQVQSQIPTIPQWGSWESWSPTTVPETLSSISVTRRNDGRGGVAGHLIIEVDSVIGVNTRMEFHSVGNPHPFPSHGLLDSSYPLMGDTSNYNNPWDIVAILTISSGSFAIRFLKEVSSGKFETPEFHLSPSA